MLIKVKTLDNKTFEIDVEGSDTILRLKEKIQETIPAKSVATQKLIYKGKILSDAQTIESGNVTNDGFVVVMSQPAAASTAPLVPAAPAEKPASAGTVSSPAVISTPAVGTSGASAVSTPLSGGAQSRLNGVTAVPPAVTASPAAATTPAVTAQSTNVSETPQANRTEPRYTEEQVENAKLELISFGYDPELVDAAMRMSKNNPELAGAMLMEEGFAEHLMNGGSIGDLVEGDDDDQEADEDMPTEFTLSEDHPLAALERSPQFNSLRRVISENSSLLPEIIDRLRVQSPELLNLILANQEAFWGLITAPMPPSRTAQAMPVRRVGAPASEGGPVVPEAPPTTDSTNVITITSEERNDIREIADICNATEEEVLPIYIACGKNKEMTINFMYDM